MVIIAPSILSADFGHLADQVKTVEAAGADWIHCDIMDGHFVPNISFGPFVVDAVNNLTDLPLDVHLMIENPDAYIPQFVDAGSDYVTVHQETGAHLHRTIQLIKSLGAKPGVSINPATPVSTLEEVIAELDLVLLMSVNPGFGGQKFIESCLAKVAKTKRLIAESGSSAILSVDGGVKASNIGALAAQGAEAFVAGSAVFGAGDIPSAIAGLRQSASGA